MSVVEIGFIGFRVALRAMTSHKNGTGPVKFALVTVSDTRVKESDENGAYLRGQIEKEGHLVDAYFIVRDEKVEIEKILGSISEDVEIIVFNGGTGIAPRDVTVDLLEKKFEKTLPGFGELFRSLSYSEIGAASVFSRAAAGILRSWLVISLPGSPSAVRLAWEKIIQTQIQHFAAILRQ